MNKLTALRLVLVLSFIGSGFSFIGYATWASAFPYISSLIENNPTAYPEQFSVAVDSMLAIPRAFFAARAFLYALSLVGLVLMWKLRPSGFHFYTLAQIVILAITVLFLGRAYLGIGDIMMTALFIGIYFHLLRGLGVFGSGTNNSENTPTTNDGNDAIGE